MTGAGSPRLRARLATLMLAVGLATPGLVRAVLAEAVVEEVVLPGPGIPLMAASACTADNRDWQEYDSFLGAMHEHSGYSDGAPGTRPADYFQRIRARGLDFAVAAEHSDNARLPLSFSETCLPHEEGNPLDCVMLPAPEAPLAPVDKWEETGRQAQAASDASFTALRGFEWTSDRFGHINVFFSRHDANAKTDGGHLSLEAFWTWFTRRPELGGGADGLATFNHPGREDTFTTADPGFNWNDFAYRPDADLRMVGIEVFNRGADYGTLRDNLPTGHAGWYAHALDKGWHLGPIGAEDAHDENWGAPAFGKTVLLARDRSAPALREALFARRYYAVGPGHNDLRLRFTVDGAPMGARLGRPAGSRLRLQAEVTAGVFKGRLQLVGNGGRVLAETGAARLQRWLQVSEDELERWYFLRVLDRDGVPIAYTAPIWVRAGGAYPPCGEWLAGDLHVHSTYSHDSWGGPGDDNTDADEAHTAGHTVTRQFRIAAARGLDYLAITDHNDVRAQQDPGWGAFGVIPVPGYENSLAGHAQMLGARKVYERSADGRDCGAGDHSNVGVTKLAACLREDGGVFQINHPAEESTRFPEDADWSLARGGYAGDVPPDTVEVWNIGWFWQPPASSGSSSDDAVRYWEGWLDEGKRVAPTGGSDNHWASTTAVQGNGQPTTWVFATERSPRGVLQGLRAGRSLITAQPPLFGTARVFIEGDADGDGVYEAGLGDALPAHAALRLRVLDGAGTQVQVLTSGGRRVLGPVAVVGTPFVLDFTAPGARWIRAEVLQPDAAEARAPQCGPVERLAVDVERPTTYCRNRLAVLALSAAVYLQ